MAKAKNTRLHRLLTKLDTLSHKKVAIVFAVVGFVTFIACINNPFQGDDITQIVKNLPVHFIQNIGFFFTSSTFYNGQDLVGTYYRPLMTTTFSLLYTLFGANTAPYHLLQIALFSGASFMLFLMLKRFMKQWLALLLALIVLVHPMNSQIVFSIACMQDTLMMFFGLSALYILISQTSLRSLIAVAVLLLLTMFSKESGLAFSVIAFAYLVLFDRRRILKFIAVMSLPVATYLTLKIIAVGLFVGNANGAPIDHLSLGARLLTSPSIVLFYFSKFIFPLSLSTTWFWTEPQVTLGGVIVPIIIDALIIAFFVVLGYLVKKHLTKKEFISYIFFGFWAALGIVPYLQIVPLDMTACETWFCFSMIGVLAMLGLGLTALRTKYPKLKIEWVVLIILVLAAAYMVRTVERGTNYSSAYNIAVRDLAVSGDNYFALNNLAQYKIDNKRLDEALADVKRSIAIHPGLANYDNLGVIYQLQGKYKEATEAYEAALTYGSMDFVYENLGQIYVGAWQDPATVAFLEKALKLYPQDSKLLTYMAIVKGALADNESAKTYISKAAQYGPVPQAIYISIMQHQPFTFSIPTSSEPIILK